MSLFRFSIIRKVQLRLILQKCVDEEILVMDVIQFYVVSSE